jgi:hypothetical protein
MERAGEEKKKGGAGGENIQGRRRNGWIFSTFTEEQGEAWGENNNGREEGENKRVCSGKGENNRAGEGGENISRGHQ